MRSHLASKGGTRLSGKAQLVLGVLVVGVLSIIAAGCLRRPEVKQPVTGIVGPKAGVVPPALEVAKVEAQQETAIEPRGSISETELTEQPQGVPPAEGRRVPRETTPRVPTKLETGGEKARGSLKEEASPLEDIFFDFDEALIREDAKAILDRNVAWLKEHQKVRITIEGHCDERGTNEYNLALGERRARAAKEYLVAAGIDPGRIVTISYGEERPFVLGHDEEAWRWNRRAHFTVLSW